MAWLYDLDWSMCLCDLVCGPMPDVSCIEKLAYIGIMSPVSSCFAFHPFHTVSCYHILGSRLTAPTDANFYHSVTFLSACCRASSAVLWQIPSTYLFGQTRLRLSSRSECMWDWGIMRRSMREEVQALWIGGYNSSLFQPLLRWNLLWWKYWE